MSAQGDAQHAASAFEPDFRRSSDPSHRRTPAKVEKKPEARKAGGVFYTPDFITKAIVRRTIAPLPEAKTPRRIAKMRFCD